MRWLAAVSLVPVVLALHHPHLKFSGEVLHGTGFRGHEHVRVVLKQRGGASFTRNVTATKSGLFQANFAQVNGPCVTFTVTATGSLGSRATLPGMKFPDCIVR